MSLHVNKLKEKEVERAILDKSVSGQMVSPKDNGIPFGWDYNPSEWSQRIPLIVMALIGFATASYLALYQLKVIGDVWEPFFGNGSKKILNSGISKILPIPDGALGALGYLLDAVTGLIGGKSRWKTMPWMVVIFGLAIGPLGAISILLVILQPVMFDAWCTLCLASAGISIIMIGPAMDEFLASLQHMKRKKKEGKNAWRVFWGKE